MDDVLRIRDLHVSVREAEILQGVSLDVQPGEIVALMGPNGSGKSTLAHVIAGHPAYQVTRGSVTYRGEDVLTLKPEERARLGLFLSFQYPVAVPGVSMGNFLRVASQELQGGAAKQERGTGRMAVAAFLERAREKLQLLRMDEAFLDRPVNDGFSGGEKKRAEILQLAILEPRMAILDETDSGLDVDALRTVAEGLTAIRSRRPDMAVLLITHYERFLKFLPPDRVLVMKEGRIVAEGAKALADRIEREGYGKQGQEPFRT